MYSYDHDLEEFVTIGLGTVSKDGSIITSNVGSGVIKAGWHCGSGPGGSGCTHNCADYCDDCNAACNCVTNTSRPKQTQTPNDCKTAYCGGGMRAANDPKEDIPKDCKEPICIGKKHDTEADDSQVPDDKCLYCEGGSIKSITLDTVQVKADGEQDELTLAYEAPSVAVNFTSVVEGKGCDYKYLWDFGDGKTSSEPSPVHMYSEAGEYNVLLEVSCNDCDSLQKTDTVVVNIGDSLEIVTPVDNPGPDAESYVSFLSNQRLDGLASYGGDSDLVNWTITPTIGEVADINPVDAKGLTIDFQPVVNHPAYQFGFGTGGSREVSDPLSYSFRVELEDETSEDTATLVQDERDTIRQEYLNHGQDVPNRNVFQPPVVTANFTEVDLRSSPVPIAYTVLYGQAAELAQEVRDAYNVRIAETLQLTSPTNYGLNLNSAWRNPERNEIVGGVINSNHQFGDAVDLSISNSTIAATGLSKAQLYCLLADVAEETAGQGLPERQSNQVLCTNPTITHVHAARQ